MIGPHGRRDEVVRGGRPTRPRRGHAVGRREVGARDVLRTHGARRVRVDVEGDRPGRRDRSGRLRAERRGVVERRTQHDRGRRDLCLDRQRRLVDDDGLGRIGTRRHRRVVVPVTAVGRDHVIGPHGRRDEVAGDRRPTRRRRRHRVGRRQVGAADVLRTHGARRVRVDVERHRARRCRGADRLRAERRGVVERRTQHDRGRRDLRGDRQRRPVDDHGLGRIGTRRHRRVVVPVTAVGRDHVIGPHGRRNEVAGHRRPTRRSRRHGVRRREVGASRVRGAHRARGIGVDVERDRAGRRRRSGRLRAERRGVVEGRTQHDRGRRDLRRDRNRRLVDDHGLGRIGTRRHGRVVVRVTAVGRDDVIGPNVRRDEVAGHRRAAGRRRGHRVGGRQVGTRDVLRTHGARRVGVDVERDGPGRCGRAGRLRPERRGVVEGRTQHDRGRRDLRRDRNRRLVDDHGLGRIGTRRHGRVVVPVTAVGRDDVIGPNVRRDEVAGHRRPACRCRGHRVGRRQVGTRDVLRTHRARRVGVDVERDRPGRRDRSGRLGAERRGIVERGTEHDRCRRDLRSDRQWRLVDDHSLGRIGTRRHRRVVVPVTAVGRDDVIGPRSRGDEVARQG